MMELTTLYWIFILPNLGRFLFITGGLLFFVFMWALLYFAVELNFTYGNQEKDISLRKLRNKFAKLALVPFVFFFAASFIPSSKQMMYMIGGYAATNVENIDKLPKNVVNAANKFLEDYTKTEETK